MRVCVISTIYIREIWDVFSKILNKIVFFCWNSGIEIRPIGINLINWVKDNENKINNTTHEHFEWVKKNGCCNPKRNRTFTIAFNVNFFFVCNFQFRPQTNGYINNFSNRLHSSSAKFVIVRWFECSTIHINTNIFIYIYRYRYIFAWDRLYLRWFTIWIVLWDFSDFVLSIKATICDREISMQCEFVGTQLKWIFALSKIRQD